MRILVALDLSEHTDTIIAKAKDIAVPTDARVWLLHVADPDPDFVGFDVGPQNERDARAAEFHADHTRVQSLADGLRSDGIQATALLVQGPYAETILKEAADLDVDLIVMGSHGRGAMYQLLVGSTSEGVIRDADCPVMLIPTQG